MYDHKEAEDAVSQELSDAELVRRVITILEGDDVRSHDDEIARLRSIADRLERPAVEDGPDTLRRAAIVLDRMLMPSQAKHMRSLAMNYDAFQPKDSVTPAAT